MFPESWNNSFAERSDFFGGLKNMIKNAKRLMNSYRTCCLLFK